MSEEQQTPDQNTPESGSQFTNPTPSPPNPLNQPASGAFNYGIQQPLPNATVVLILGILSIVTCCCYGVIGIILGVIALVLSKKDKTLYATNMSYYTEASYKNLNAGRICAIIGLVLNLLLILLMVLMIAIFGWSTVSDQEALQEALRGMQG